TYIVEKETELLVFLLETMSNRSRNSVKSILKRGQVAIDGRTTTQFDDPLNPGQEVNILTNKAAKRLSRLEGLSIVHEDDALIVINKDPGVLSMGSKHPKELDAYRQLTDYVKAEHPSNRIFIVHRLDRDTSGIMIYAKSEAIKNKLQENWHNIMEKRLYIALVEGELTVDSDSVSSWLNETSTHRVYSTENDKGGKYAITHYKKINANHDYSLLKIELETGRKNQIRVHMQDIGHPVVGDKKYGSRKNPIRRLGLHAKTLAFTHPQTNKLVEYTVPAPKSFIETIR
ncbi:MAG: RluA family pseudouridine synthase, partial [Atopostipes sp.]|nr:RluA family pseudouridine synthase [Atopostipes sp.]